MSQVHYEVFARKTPGAPWALSGATEDRAQAEEIAAELLSAGRAAGVKVVRETFDPETGQFRSSVLSSQGMTEDVRRRTERERDPSVEPACRTPDDLRHPRGRELIGRVLDEWLKRFKVTPFELLHRADLVEKLEASGFELQHAIQKIALPEAQAAGRPVHEVIRYYQDLIDRACERVLKDERRTLFPDLSCEALAEAAERLMPAPDRTYRLSGAVAKALAGVDGWSAKTDKLLDLADQAPRRDEARKFALHVIEQPLCEIAGTRAGLGELVGAGLDLGGQLAALTRLAAPREVEMLIKIEPEAARIMPALDGAASRLGRWLETGVFPTTTSAVARRVMRELGGPKRLRPEDPSGEIDVLRALAMAMTAASNPAMTLDEVQSVFVERSRRLVTPEFVTAYLGEGGSVWDDARALVRLCENVAGGANKRAAARWLAQHLNAPKVEDALRGAPDSPRAKLATLAALQKAVRHAGLPELDVRPAIDRLGQLGGLVEAEGKVMAAIARADAPLAKRLVYLLQIAAGEQAPMGPATVRAKAELLRLLKEPTARAELAAAPELAARLAPMLESTLAA
jgi:hypothetical protein